MLVLMLVLAALGGLCDLTDGGQGVNADQETRHEASQQANAVCSFDRHIDDPAPTST
jgi:hypothetical protein